MAKKVYDDDKVAGQMRDINWSGDEATGGLPVSGRLVENYIKSVDDKTQATDEIAKGETKPVTSNAVALGMVGMVTGIDVHDSEDGTEYVLEFTQRQEDGTEGTVPVNFPKYTDDDKVVINIDMTDGGGAEVPQSQYLPLGQGFTLKYVVAVGTAGGSPVDGYQDLKARVVMKRGATVMEEFKDAEFAGVTAGMVYSFDASPYLKDATSYTIQVEAEAMYQEKKIIKTASARVTMVAMDMATTYKAGNGLQGGGYTNDVNIPFTIKGTTGEKNLYYRLNGGTPYTAGLSGGSGTQSKNITIALSEMQEGRNVVEAYALHEDSGVASTVHYITLLKAGGAVKDYVGLMFAHGADGFQADWKDPVLQAEQFSAWDFSYGAYTADGNTANVRVESGGTLLKEDRLQRGETGSYGKTNVNTEPQSYTLACGTAQAVLRVETAGHPDIEATLAPDAVCTFDASGRTNTENNAASWKSGKYFMDFEDVLWSVNGNGAGSGWHKDRLVLSGGAAMTLTAEGGYFPFNDADKPIGYSIREAGMTIEIEYSTANVGDTGAELITCLGQLENGNRYGLVVTPEEAKFLTGVVTEAVDAGEIIRYEDSVGTKFEPGTNIRITYVFYPVVETNEQRGLIGFYVNGEESAASRWQGKVNFDIKEPLRFASEGADLNVKSVRIYDKALTSDEVLNNYIVDRGHLEDTETEQGVRSLDEENRILSEGDTVSMDKLMGMMKERGNSILVLVGTGSVGSEVPSESDTINVMDALAQLNDKKANKLVREIRFYNGTDRSMDFILKNAYARIQGTSSVNYARKNLRFYFQKTAPGETVSLSYGEIDGNGNQGNPVTTEGKGNFFKLRKNSVGAKLACPKCDYSDSSMTTNTGGAKFINDGLKEMGLLTPAQKYAQDKGLADDIRSAIDGTPCDLFVAMRASDDLTYYGQYNCNNEKSDSYPIFGQGETIGTETWGEGDTLNYLEADEEGHKQYLPICFETLNNSNPCCLFQWLPSDDPDHVDFMDNNFDGGLEFNHPKDTFWSDGGGDADEEPNLKDHLGTGDIYEKMYKATDRMMSFIYRCIKETEAGKNMRYNKQTHLFEGVDYEDEGGKFPPAKWQSDTFKREAGKYFDMAYLAAYYLYVDFQLGVDQLAKNMLIRTWDGVKWYITYYDGDCQLGSDNKSFLTGKYDDNRQTKRDGAYVMQGHNSWLWNLLLANCRPLMEEVMVKGVDGGTSFMSAFSIQKALDHFDKEQMERWCSRLYNKSGIFKYVYPFLNPMKVGADGAEQTYPQIYGLKGSLKNHRAHFIRRRYDMKQVEYGYVSTMGAQFYQSTAALDAGYVLKPMEYSLTIPYRVQLSTSNGVQADSGLVDAGTMHSLQLTKMFGENDPLKIIGAAKIRELVWHEDAFAIGFNFGLFTSLVKLDMSVGYPGSYRNGSFMVSTNALILLEELNMRNNLLARNGDNGSAATLDLGFQSRLKKADLRGTGLTRLTLATGAPITDLKLPGTLEELFIEDLPRLQDGGLSLEGTGNITGYRHAKTPGVDGFAMLEKLHADKLAGRGKLARFRMEIDMVDDGSLLEKYYGYGTYTAAGMYDNEHSGFTGRVRLTRYMEKAELQRYQERYPGLDMVLPEYTVIKHDEDITDGTGFTNTGNKTGYDHGTDYVPDGHVARILERRFRCLGKKTAEGVETVCKLHDKDSRFYADAGKTADATPAVLTGEEGDVWVYEPHYWYKGVDDFLGGGLKYKIFSSLDREPSKAESVKLAQDELEAVGGYAIRMGEGYGTLEEARAQKQGHGYRLVDVKGWRQVRWPGFPSADYGAVFLGKDGNIIRRMNATGETGMLDGAYLFCTVPEDAERLAFTVKDGMGSGYVLLTKSDGVEAIEPDWVEHTECLCAAYEALSSYDKLHSRSGVQSSARIGVNYLRMFAKARGDGFQLVDWEMHKDVANLFYAKYGRTDIQRTCGYGTWGVDFKTGLADECGMRDTFANPQNTLAAGAYTETQDGTFKNVTCPSVMGYENWYSDKAELMNDTYNVGKADYTLHVAMSDGSVRNVKGLSGWGGYPKHMVNGRYMDVWPAKAGGSTSSGYYDQTVIAGNINPAVVRSGNHNDAANGVAYVSTNYNYGASGNNWGTRLAFRGKIVIAKSVAAFKAVIEIA